MIFALIASSSTKLSLLQSQTLVKGGSMPAEKELQPETRTKSKSKPQPQPQPQPQQKKRKRKSVLQKDQVSPKTYDLTFRAVRDGVPLQLELPHIGIVTITKGPWAKNNERAVFVNDRNKNYPDANGEKKLSYVDIMPVLTSYPEHKELARYMIAVIVSKQVTQDLFNNKPDLFAQDRNKIAVFKRTLAIFLALILFAERKRARSATLSFKKYLEKVITGDASFNIEELNTNVPITKKTKLGVQDAAITIDYQQQQLAQTGASTPAIKAYACEALSTGKRKDFVKETKRLRQSTQDRNTPRNLFTEFSAANENSLPINRDSQGAMQAM
jgi:hypothetical protein